MSNVPSISPEAYAAEHTHVEAPRYDTHSIYYVVQSPTSAYYATSADGVTCQIHHSLKRARYALPDGVMTPINESDFLA